MKKILILSLLVTTSVFAAVIDANTKIKWNSKIITQALNDAGLQDTPGTYADVATTYNLILKDLLQRDTFSVTDAVSVCMTQCNKSDFLKEGKGQSGRKCGGICDDFGTALVEENNKGIGNESGASVKSSKKLYDGISGDFYAASSTNNRFVKGIDDAVYTKECDWGVFDASTNTKVAQCKEYDKHIGGGGDAHDYVDIYFDITDSRYKSYVFIVSCADYLMGNVDIIDGYGCVFDVKNPLNEKYDSLYGKGWVIKDIKGLDLKKVQSLANNTILTADARSKLAELERAVRIDLPKLDKFVSNFESKSVRRGDMYDEFNRFVDKYFNYCDVYNDNCNWGLYSFYEQVDGVVSHIKSQAGSGVITKFKNVKTKSVEEARQKIIKDYFDNALYIDWSKLTCSGECKRFGNDIVNCMLGGAASMGVFSFEFDSICAK